MILDILKYPDPRLKEVSKPVETFDAELSELLDNMAETMYAANGVGLAAPQVNRQLRIFVIDVTPEEEGSVRRLFEFINPRIMKAEGKTKYEEGCLSVPGFSEEVERKAKVWVEYFDREGNPKRMEAEGLLGVAIQHENDHLDGTLFVDRLSPLKRRFLKKKLEKVAIL